MSGGAWFSDDEVYRYALLRIIDHGLIQPALSEYTVNFIMLNPSTATADVDDPTIRRCMGYARSWGYGELMVTNLFAFRATDPKAMKAAADPVGPENHAYISKIARASHLVVAAWGSHGPYRGRDMAVRRLLSSLGIPLMCLATSKDGHPKHPLYLRADLTPSIYASCTPDTSAPVPARSPNAAIEPAATTNGGDDSQPTMPPLAMSERGTDTIPGSLRSATSEHTETPTRL